ncbi:histidinol-phosphatase [Desulfosarcina widdelii]|uniref:Histidinol-phosphatase n=1 Tax=Desulfosarcina widdelii TaxID=947919 RepID=A0A5K7Z0G1_9BACT|nr:PHP domain-containing protein [Desulfosarcina widdelii]BBO74140.1 histidinol-phosphatase [Desulfosarcina widdelii]
MIIDMHVHTTFSPCSRMRVDEAVAAAGQSGLDGICITDHDTMDIRHTLTEGVQENGVVVIFGMEYTTSRGDFLVFGPFEALDPGLSADRLLRIVDQSGGIAIAAHPFRKERPVDARIVEDGRCRVIESLNGRNTARENAGVERWCDDYGLTECGGSDAHTIEEVGSFATRFFVPVRTRSDLVAALKNRLCRPEDRTDDGLYVPDSRHCFMQAESGTLFR